MSQNERDPRDEQEKDTDRPYYFFLGIRPNGNHHTPEACYLQNPEADPRKPGASGMTVAEMRKFRENFKKGESLKRAFSISAMQLAYGDYGRDLDDLHELKKRYKHACSLAAPRHESSSVAQFGIGLVALTNEVKGFHRERYKAHHDSSREEYLKSRNTTQQPSPRSWTPNGWKKK